MVSVNADLLVRGLLVGLASSVTVGPVAVLCIQRTLSKSRYSGFLSGLGVACADTMLAIISYFFYALLKGQIEQYKDVISIFGGVFVVIVGVAIFFKKPAPQVRRNHTGSIASWRDFVSMFGFTMANFITVIPYIFAFFAMLGVEPHDGSNDTASIVTSMLVLGGFFIGAAAWWFVLTFIISLFRSRFQPQHMHLINRVAGIIIGLLGVITILTTALTPTLNGTPK